MDWFLYHRDLRHEKVEFKEWVTYQTLSFASVHVRSQIFNSKYNRTKSRSYFDFVGYQPGAGIYPIGLKVII